MGSRSQQEEAVEAGPQSGTTLFLIWGAIGIDSQSSLLNPSENKGMSFVCPKEGMQGREERLLLGHLLKALFSSYLLPILVIDGALFTHPFPAALNRG